MIVANVRDREKFFLLSAQSNGAFGSEAWLAIYGSQLQLRGIYANDGQLIGGFFYLETKKFGFKFIKLPPYTPHCGLFYKNQSTNPSSVAAFRKEVIELISDYFLKLKSSLCILAFPIQEIDLQPFIWKGFKVIPNYTYRIDLKRELSEITADFDSKNRNTIAKAAKAEVNIKINALSATELLQFFSNSLHTVGANVYSKELEAVLSMSQSATFSISAFYQNKLVACVYCLFDQNVCYYLLGGTNKDAGVQGLNNLLILKAIELAKEKGCTVFDFEGSMLQGVEKFFRGFGGQLQAYYTANKGAKWLEVILKFKEPGIF